jgi:branched-chain amino acid transport system permease protein
MNLSSQLLQSLISGVTVGSIYALSGLGFTVVYNACSSLNFTQGEYLMLGGMIGITLYEAAGFPFWAALPLTITTVTLVAVLFERLTIYPSKEMSPISFIMITFGASIFLRRISLITWGSDPKSMNFFLGGAQKVTLFGAVFLLQGLWIILAIVIIVGLLVPFFRYTLLGRTIRATSINKEAAKMVGIDVKRMISYSFVIAGVFGGLGGFIMAPVTLMTFDRGDMLGMKGLCAAVVGGIGSIPGAIIGGILLGILETLGAFLISSGYKDAVAFCMLIVVFLIRPAGILGQTKISKV